MHTQHTGMPARALAAGAFALLIACLLGGCATTNQSKGLNAEGVDEAAQFVADKPLKLRPFYRKLYRDGEWNAVLNFNQLGLAAMDTGQLDVARKSFDQSIARISSIYADDPNAKKALSVFSEERVKDFKGEPYERAMAFFYRGVLYAQQGDYQNARASFLAADLQGTLAEKENYDGDFGLMKYAAGWASICAGDTERGKTLVEEAKKSDSKISALPDLPSKSLLLVDTGLAPKKVGMGKYKEAVGFQPGSSADGDIVVRGPNGSLEIKEWLTGGDVYVQASTRGGRPVDAILNGKAQFKSTANAGGDVAVATGAAMMTSDNSNVQAAGAVVALIGLVAKGVAYATTPAADLRQWTSLPASVLLFTGDVEPGPGLTMVSTANPTPVLLPVQQRTGACWIGWGRTRSALAAEAGGVAVVADTNVEYADREAKNNAFRATLKSEFVGVATATNTQVPKKETTSAAKL